MEIYLIATPIGNRSDMGLRALEIIFSLDILYCEDTRKTKQLLDYYCQTFEQYKNAPQPKLLSYFEHNENQRIPQIIDQIKSGQKVGLVSNAGTPTISDPGFRLVKTCIENQIKVTSIPGASAVISALVASGFSSDKFTFLGFLPRKIGKQIKIWESLKNSNLNQTIIFYESPFRILKTLDKILATYGNISLCIARELTKIHEEIKTQPISTWIDFLQKNKLKGELVILFRDEKV